MSRTGEVMHKRNFKIDADFGSSAGVKATVCLGTIETSSGIKNRIEAVVHLPADTRLQEGEAVAFTGTLQRVDRFARKFFIAEAITT